MGKICNDCGTEKSFNEFSTRADTKDGLMFKCRICDNAASKKNYQKNPEKKKASVKEYQKANPDARRKGHLRRRAKKAENGVFRVTTKEITKLKATACYLCKDKPSTHIDHVLPIHRGGRHSVGNLLGACAPCNLSKGPKLLSYYRYQYLLQK